MRKVQNKKIIRKLAQKTYQAHGKRNLLVLGATLFTTSLLVTLFAIGFSYWQVLQNRSLQMEGIAYDLMLSEPTLSQRQKAQEMPEITAAGIEVKCAVITQAAEKSVSKMQLFWQDDNVWQRMTQPALASISGHYPMNRNEIMLSAAALKKLGIKQPKLGMEIPLQYVVLSKQNVNETVTRDSLTLSGYFTDYTGKAKGFVSEAFYKASEVLPTDFTQGKMYLTLANKWYFEKDILAIQKQLNLTQQQYLAGDGQKNSEFIQLLAVLGLFVGLLFASGYLFIFNTLQIAVHQDIQYYGQLKTLGTTRRQLKNIIYYQAFRSGLWGILFGSVIGASAVQQFLPAILKLLNPEFTQVMVQPVRLLGAILAGALLAALALFCGSYQPAQLVAELAPMAVLRYQPRLKKTWRKPAKHWFFWQALRNIFRDRKQAAIIWLSLSLSLALVLVIQVVILENNGKFILNQTQPVDLQIRNETILDETGAQNLITRAKISQLKKIKGVKSVAVVESQAITLPYQAGVFDDYYKALYASRYAPGDYAVDLAKYQANDPLQTALFAPRLVGLDAIAFQQMQPTLTEKVDAADFETGKVAVVDRWLNFVPKDAIGKTLQFQLTNAAGNAITVQTKIASIGQNPAYFSGGYSPNILISQAYFEKITGQPMVELVNIQYQTAYSEATETQIKKLFAKTPALNFESKLARYQEMVTTEKQVRILGMSLSFLLIVLAVLNFTHTISASIESRRQEFALMACVGMTRRQLQKVLMLEGGLYSLLALLVAFVSGVPLSYLVFQNVNRYQLTYQFPIGPCLLFSGFLIALCCVFPPLYYRLTTKKSLLERLRIN